MIFGSLTHYLFCHNAERKIWEFVDTLMKTIQSGTVPKRDNTRLNFKWKSHTGNFVRQTIINKANFAGMFR